MAGKTAKSSRSLRGSKTQDSRRKVVVFSALAGSLLLTAGFLQLLSPPPVRAQIHSTLLAGDPIERITSTLDQPAGRPWKYIYIHHTKTSYADASETQNQEIGDHFIVCNGAGERDGSVLVTHRWHTQKVPLPPKGASHVEPDFISIALVGDFDRIRPTAAQMQGLNRLVKNLRNTYGIPANRIFTAADSPTEAGIGKLFPAADFGKKLRD